MNKRADFGNPTVPGSAPSVNHPRWHRGGVRGRFPAICQRNFPRLPGFIFQPKRVAPGCKFWKMGRSLASSK